MIRLLAYRAALVAQLKSMNIWSADVLGEAHMLSVEELELSVLHYQGFALPESITLLTVEH